MRLMGDLWVGSGQRDEEGADDRAAESHAEQRPQQSRPHQSNEYRSGPRHGQPDSHPRDGREREAGCGTVPPEEGMGSLIKVLHVVGARPNFMKVAPVMRALALRGGRFEQRLVHTGQHYDEAMSQVFFDELEIGTPDEDLEVGSGSHAWQTAQIMMRFEPVVTRFAPDWVMVVGDVNSTIACTRGAAT